MQKFWIEEHIFKFDPDSKNEVFSIDTPPPTVSGKMHIGHAFSYTHEDIIARVKRMQGFNVFYPFGTDDNGLATERLIEKTKKVKGSKIPRDEFVKLCLETLDKDLRPKYVEDWKRIGMSCDWDIFYTTINEHSQRIAQRMFLDLVKKKRAERNFAPVMVCPQCHTSIAQVELEDLERTGKLNHIQVEVEGGEKVIFATTRPELMMACIAITVHPGDERYKHLVGKKATIPAANFQVPILADTMTKMEFGSGVVYWCPFGDINDIEFVTKHPELKVKHIMNPDGTLNEHAGKYAGMKSADARKAVLEDWEACGAIVKQEETKQILNVHERCGTPVEFIAMNQWFIKYLDLKEKFLERGNELKWHPSHMKNRFDNWIKGLKWDWNISRQRFSGVPFPVWYDKETGEPIYAEENQLPVDPLKDLPNGYTKEQVIPEKDVMDTWATSSLTPRIAAELYKNHPVYEKLLPMSLRPQAHDIITFWLFNTVVRSHLHDDSLPWKDTMISGWALDPHGKKMSKSKGNVVEPQAMIEKYSADCLRFWSAGTKLGDDLPFQEKDLLTGKKVVTKLWNASKFVFMNLEDYNGEKPKELKAIDAWVLSKLNEVIRDGTAALEKYEFFRVKADTEKFFYQVFCDNYLEIIKDRMYNPENYSKEERLSAQYTLHTTLLIVYKLFAPIIPHVTDVLYRAYYQSKDSGLPKSIHNTDWPGVDEGAIDEETNKTGDFVVVALEHARRAKSEQNKSLKEPITSLTCEGNITADQFKSVEADLAAASKAETITYKQLEEGSNADFKCDIVF